MFFRYIGSNETYRGAMMIGQTAGLSGVDWVKNILLLRDRVSDAAMRGGRQLP
jgi:hypothetical protein